MAEFERSPRVLVVEDDADISDVLVRSLRLEGYEVHVAGDGVTALDEAHAFLPDLVILDLGLPRSTASRSRGSCAATTTCRS